MESKNFQEQNFPLVFRNKIRNWKMVHYSKENWCTLFKDKPLKFRQGKKTFTETPYWEYLCKSKELSLSKFFELSTENSDHWLYFDYKYIKDVFPEREDFINELDWAELGLLDSSKEESVLWIGNEGAHTPCHKDTYGCNLVAQLFGRKLWVLMPPEETENLKSVRVPYEESSIYSLLNFYSPKDSLLNIKEAYKVVMSPGDVLFVPRHWWHYVENLEPAISINIWMPLEEDDESRLEESLVQYYVSSICQDLTEEEAKQVLNPNEYSLIVNPCTISLIEKCLENYKRKSLAKEKNQKQMKFRIEGECAQVEKLCMEAFVKEKKAKLRSPSTGKESQVVTSQRVSIAKALINAYCSQTNINLIKEALLNLKKK